MVLKELEPLIDIATEGDGMKLGLIQTNPDGTEHWQPYEEGKDLVSDLLIYICVNTDLYGLVQHPVTKKMTYARVLDNSKKLKVIGAVTTKQVTDRLYSACMEFVDNFEEDIVETITHNTTHAFDPFLHLCVRKAGYCDKENTLAIPGEQERIYSHSAETEEYLSRLNEHTNDINLK